MNLPKDIHIKGARVSVACAAIAFILCMSIDRRHSEFVQFCHFMVFGSLLVYNYMLYYYSDGVDINKMFYLAMPISFTFGIIAGESASEHPADLVFSYMANLAFAVSAMTVLELDRMSKVVPAGTDDPLPVSVDSL